MKNALLSYLALALAVGCGAAPEDFADEQSDDFGQAEQSFSAPVSSNYQFGTRTASSHLQCDRTSTGQVCSIPLTKNPTYAFDNSVGGTERALITSIVSAIDSSLASWSFTEVTMLDDPTIIFEDALHVCAGTSASNNIDSFGCVFLTAQGNGLTEGAGVKGSYTNHSFGVVHVDLTKIQAKVSAAADRNLVYKHAAGSAVLAWMGLGLRTDAGANNNLSRREVSTTLPLGTLTSGEQCRANGFVATANGQFTNAINPCPGD